MMKILIFIDRVFNVGPLVGRRWETVSTRAWEAKLEGKLWGKIAVPVIDTAFFWQKDHCRKSYEWEKSIRKDFR